MYPLWQTLNSCRLQQNTDLWVEFRFGWFRHHSSAWHTQQIHSHAICFENEIEITSSNSNNNNGSYEWQRRRLSHHSRLSEHSVCTKYSKRLVMLYIGLDISYQILCEQTHKPFTKRVIARAAFQNIDGIHWPFFSFKERERKKNSIKNIKRIQSKDENYTREKKNRFNWWSEYLIWFE